MWKGFNNKNKGEILSTDSQAICGKNKNQRHNQNTGCTKNKSAIKLITCDRQPWM